MKNLKRFDELNENALNEIKFVKTPSGVSPANKKDIKVADVKIGKDTWSDMYAKFNKLGATDKKELTKAFKKLGLI